jgi:hypothetical protein
MVHPGRPPLSPSKPYCRPLNYPEYVKEFNPNTHVRVFKVAIRANSEMDDVKIVNLFSFTFRDIMSDYYNNYLEDYPNYTFANCN